MTKCPSCGSSGLFLKTVGCSWCNRITCQKCTKHNLVEVKLESEAINQPPYKARDAYTTLVACSQECVDAFAKKVMDYPMIADVGTDTVNFGRNAFKLWEKAVLKAFTEAPSRNQAIVRMVEKAMRLDTEKARSLLTRRLENGIAVPGGFMDRFRDHALLVMAQNLEQAGRPLDAATGYERLKMYDKARQLREKDKQVIVKQTAVALDLNTLLDQVRKEGLVAVYKCPNCGGNLRINKESKASSLRTCAHCGKEIQAMDLSDFLKTILS